MLFDGYNFAGDDEYVQSLCSFVSGSEASCSLGADTESDKSQPSKSTESLLRTSGVHDIQTPDIYSTKKGKIIEQRKFPGGLSTINSASNSGLISAPGYIGRPSVSPCQIRSLPPSKQSFGKSINEMTDFEREFFSEDYMSGGEEEDGNVFSSEAPLFSRKTSLMLDDVGSGRFKDFIRCLPVHLSKCILGMLDKNSLTNCLCLSKHWRLLAEEVKQDCMVHQIMAEEIMLMQVSCMLCDLGRVSQLLFITRLLKQILPIVLILEITTELQGFFVVHIRLFQIISLPHMQKVLFIWTSLGLNE